LQITIELDQYSNIPLQTQIFESLRKQVLTNRLKSGASMPSTRVLSEQLGVSRNTILIVYERLIAEGYLYTDKTTGTFVNPNLPEDSLTLFNAEKTPKREINITRAFRNKHSIAFKGRGHKLFNPYRSQLEIDFWVGRPDPEAFPAKVWNKFIIKNLAKSKSKMTEYPDPCGIKSLRRAISEHIQLARGITTNSQNVIITNGIQQGLNLVARLLIKPGDEVMIESPCYQGAAFVFESYGAKLTPVKVDKDGLDVSKLPNKQTSLIYVTPSHQYPLGYTMTLERRIKLLEWARNTGTYIIEDDYDSDFRHHGSPLTAVAGQDDCNSVIYMGTFSKSIGAALRLGYIVIPDELLKPIEVVKTLMDNGHSWLDQAVMYDFLESGEYTKHLRRIRRAYLNRRNYLVEQLNQNFGDVKLSGLAGGMHLTWHLSKSDLDANQMQEIAHSVGVGIYSLQTAAAFSFNRKALEKHTLMLGYSSITEANIKEGITRIRNSVDI